MTCLIDHGFAKHGLVCPTVRDNQLSTALDDMYKAPIDGAYKMVHCTVYRVSKVNVGVSNVILGWGCFFYVRFYTRAERTAALSTRPKRLYEQPCRKWGVIVRRTTVKTAAADYTCLNNYCRLFYTLLRIRLLTLHAPVHPSDKEKRPEPPIPPFHPPPRGPLVSRRRFAELMSVCGVCACTL